MENTQQTGSRYAQYNLDAAVSMGGQASRFWRQCAALQAQSAHQIAEESLRITHVILKTQADMVEAAGQFFSEGQRVVAQNIEQAGRQAEEDVREAGSNGSQALKNAQHGAQQAAQRGSQSVSQGSRRAS
jgi:hypothetical protein